MFVWGESLFFLEGALFYHEGVMDVSDSVCLTDFLVYFRMGIMRLIFRSRRRNLREFFKRRTFASGQKCPLS